MQNTSLFLYTAFMTTYIALILSTVSQLNSKIFSMDYKPIVVFKQQGQEQDNEMDDMGENDFLLGIQTEFQRDMMVDEFGEGLSVLLGISNREDCLMLTQLFRFVQKRIGPLQPKLFMSDDAEQFWNAWVGVFGLNQTKKLLCAWHVNRAWRKSLAEHTAGKEERVSTYNYNYKSSYPRKMKQNSKLHYRSFSPM